MAMKMLRWLVVLVPVLVVAWLLFPTPSVRADRP
jgi:hypothetical protein